MHHLKIPARLAALALLALSALAGAARGAELRVVATTPELAWFAEELGGDHVDVESLTRGKENMHAFGVKPRTIVSIAKADLLLENGLSLEAVWLPDLLLAARNKELTYDTGRRVNCSTGIEPLNVPTDLSRKEGDVHPMGNPHMALSPLAGPVIAGNVHAALVRLDPKRKADYDKAHAALVERLAEAEQRWQKYVPLFEGLGVVVYHQEFDYLVDYLGMQQRISIEPKPGIPPTPSHLAKVIAVVREHEVPAILVAPWANNRQAKSIAQKTDAALLELPAMVGGAKYATGYIAWIDGMLEELRVAYGLPEPDFDEDEGGEG